MVWATFLRGQNVMAGGLCHNVGHITHIVRSGPFMLLTSTVAKIMYSNIVPDTSEFRLYQ